MGSLCCRPAAVHDEPTTSVIIPRSHNTEPIGHLLVFINPNSGAGKGVKIFKKRVASQFEKNNISYELIITNGSNHARNVVLTHANLHKFNGIVIISGDGLVFEVINGLSERPDAIKVVSSMPIGIIPSGSGNGLLSSVFVTKGWTLKNPGLLKQAVVVATGLKPEAQPVNLLHVQTERKNIAAFLSIGWGIMADIDIESERFRSSLGSQRFVAGALIRCLNLRSYRGRLSYKPYVARSDFSQNPPFEVYGNSRCDMLSVETDNSMTCETPERRWKDNFWRERHLINSPDLEDTLPDDWISIEDEFIGVYAMSLSHIATDGPYMPLARLDDDKIYLTFILKKDIKGKFDMFKMLSAIETAKHLELGFVKCIQVSAFRLETFDQKSVIVVDGEVMDARKIQVSTTNLKTAVFT